MTITYNDISALVDAGQTPAQIADSLNASGLTLRKIALDQLLFVMNQRAMLVRLVRPADTGEKWSGSVVNMILAVNAGGTAEQIAAVNQWFSHITNDRNSYYDTTIAEYAAPLWQMRLLFGDQPTMPTVADFDAIAELGAGWKYNNVTEAEVQACIDAHAAEVAAQAQAEADAAARQTVSNALYGASWNQHIAPVLDGDATKATTANLVTALRAAADAVEAG